MMTTQPASSRRIRQRVDRLVPQTLVALGIATVVEVGLRVTTLPRLTRWLGIRLAKDSGEAPPKPEAVVLPRWSGRRVRAASRVVAHWPFGDTCLRQCLVTGQRLRRLHPVLRIGVRAGEDGSMLAHSWLEVEGVSIDPTANTYLPLEGR